MLINLNQVKQQFANGSPIACPTETVYGLAAPATDDTCIKKIFELKGRPSDNPLIVHFKDLKQVEDYLGPLPSEALQLAQAYWPGPLTLVLPYDGQHFSSRVQAGLLTLACRIPDSQAMIELIDCFGPIVAPSCNPSGRPSATCEQHIYEDFGEDFPVFKGGKAHKGVESTVVLWTKNSVEIGRLGAISQDDLERCLGYLPAFKLKTSSQPACPGQKYRHYAPTCQLTYGQSLPNDQQVAILGFKQRTYPLAHPFVCLGDLNDPEYTLNTFYETLRALDRNGYKKAWVDIDFPKEGLWLTLHERLEKAAQN